MKTRRYAAPAVKGLKHNKNPWSCSNRIWQSRDSCRFFCRDIATDYLLCDEWFILHSLPPVNTYHC